MNIPEIPPFKGKPGKGEPLLSQPAQSNQACWPARTAVFCAWFVAETSSAARQPAATSSTFSH